MTSFTGKNNPMYGKPSPMKGKTHSLETIESLKKKTAHLYKGGDKAKRKRRLERAKAEGIAHYGGKCTCCAESQKEFLTLEHVKGRDERAKRLPRMEWLRAQREGFPDTYTVLCYNCNCAKGVYGVCPHQVARGIQSPEKIGGDHLEGERVQGAKGE